MQIDKLTAKFQSALSEAQSIALGADNGFIEPEHVMRALLNQEDGTCRTVLLKAGVDLKQFSKCVDEAITQCPKVSGMGGDVHISNALNRVFNLTDKLAQKRKDSYIASELFILAVLEKNGSLAKLIKRCGGQR